MKDKNRPPWVDEVLLALWIWIALGIPALLLLLS